MHAKDKVDSRGAGDNCGKRYRLMRLRRILWKGNGLFRRALANAARNTARAEHGIFGKKVGVPFVFLDITLLRRGRGEEPGCYLYIQRTLFTGQ